MKGVDILEKRYRKRLYDKYITTHESIIAPSLIKDLNSRAPFLKKIISQHLPKNKGASILELACGHGAFQYFIKKAGYTNVRGIDRSPEQVAQAQALGINDIVLGDLFEELAKCEPNSTNCIISFDVIEHMDKNEILDFSDQVYRVLKPGGNWIIHTANGESPFSGRMLYYDFTHEIAFTTESIAQVLLASGFSEVNSYEDKPVIHGIVSFCRYILWKIFRMILRLYIGIETGNISKSLIFSQTFLAVAKK